MRKQADYEAMNLYDQLLRGLQEATAQARGELTLRTTTLPAPPPPLSKARVAAIRKRVGMSQAVFAHFLNVPTKTLQSWEQGERTPKAGEARLLQIFSVAPEELVRIMREAEGVKEGRAKRGARDRGRGSQSKRGSQRGRGAAPSLRDTNRAKQGR